MYVYVVVQLIEMKKSITMTSYVPKALMYYHKAYKHNVMNNMNNQNKIHKKLQTTMTK